MIISKVIFRSEERIKKLESSSFNCVHCIKPTYESKDGTVIEIMNGLGFFVYFSIHYRCIKENHFLFITEEEMCTVLDKYETTNWSMLVTWK